MGKALDGTLAFTLDLDPVAGTYQFTINNGPISNGSEVNFTNLSGVGGGNDGFKALGTNSVGPNDIMISGNGSVNTNNDSIGIGNGQSINGSEVVRFDFLSNITVVTPAAANGSTGFNYDSHYSITKFTQEMDTVNPAQGGAGADFTIRLIDANNDFVFYSAALPEAGESLITGLNTFTVTIYSGDPDAGGVVVHIYTSNAAGVVQVVDMLQGQYYVVNSTVPFDAIQIAGTAGTETFKLGVISIETVSDVDPFSLHVPLTGTDGDGDTAAGSIDINFLPDALTTSGTSGADNFPGTNLSENYIGQAGDDIIHGLGGNDVLAGGLGSDTIFGDAGNDTLDGGAGADFLTGGEGSDFFAGGAGFDTITLTETTAVRDTVLIDLDAFGSNSVDDLIIGYNSSTGATGDVIDLSDIFTSLGAGDPIDAAGVASIVRLFDDGTGGSLLQVDNNGTLADGTFVTVADLQGVAPASTVNILWDDSQPVATGVS